MDRWIWVLAVGCYKMESGHHGTYALQTHPHGVLLLQALLIQSSHCHVGREVIRTLFSSAHKKHLHREHSKETYICHRCGVLSV